MDPVKYTVNVDPWENPGHGYIVTAPPTVPTTKVLAQRWCTAVRSDVSELRNAIITCRRVTEESPRDPSSRDIGEKNSSPDMLIYGAEQKV